MNTKSSIRLFAGALAAATLFSSCNSTGPSFQPVPVPPGKGVVYIYRQPKLMGSGVFGTVKANGTPVTRIKNGGYYPYIANPGNNHFSVSTETTNEANVMVKSGSESYLKTTIGIGAFVGRLKFTEVSPQIGRGEIAECKLLEPAAP